MSGCRRPEDPKHSHRGGSSESLLDKSTILERLGIAPGEAVLDAGCGNGYMAKEFARRVGETGKVHALDPDGPSIEALKSGTDGLAIDAFVGDIAKQTKLAASSLDLIYVSNVLHGFSQAQMEGFVKEVKRLLKPHGRLAVVEIKKEETPFGPPHDLRFSPEELTQAISLTPAGLGDVGQYFYMQVFNR